VFLLDFSFFHLAVAATSVDFIYSIALKRCNFEVNPAELYDVPHSQAVGLVFWTEVLEYVVDGRFFPHDQPH